MSREVLQMALEVLKGCLEHPDAQDSIIAIEHELAQPEQEPVAWTVAGQVRDWGKDFSAYQTQHYVRPIYTSPPQREWVGLTDDEIDAALGVYDSFGGRLDARKIEAKLKEKNT